VPSTGVLQNSERGIQIDSQTERKTFSLAWTGRRYQRSDFRENTNWWKFTAGFTIRILKLRSKGD